MTRTITVSFRNEDEDLWQYIEKVAGKPVSGVKIRNILHEYMDARELVTKRV